MDDRNLRPLPRGWVWTRLGDVCLDPQYGWTTSASAKGSLHLLRTTDITSGVTNWGSIPFCKEEPLTKQKYLLNDGDIVISRAGSVGYSQLIKNPKEAVFASYLIRFRPLIDESYLAYFLKSPIYWDSISEKSLGIAIPNVNASKLRLIAVPLPPLPEQRRIVTRIEALFTGLDAGTEALNKVKTQLKRYRQSVLKAAFEGKLTAGWRKAHKGELEPASALLEKIKAERTKSGKYKELPPLDTSGLPELPEGWVWTILDALTIQVGDVDHKMPKAVGSGVPYVSPKDFYGDNGISFDTAKVITREDYVALTRKIKPTPGDILLSRYGTVGEVRKVSTNREFQASYSIAIIKPVLSEKLSDYLTSFLRSGIAKEQIQRSIRASSQPDLGLEYIRKLAIPFPPLPEQCKIVEEIDRCFSVADQIEKIAEQSLKQADRLRQSILKSAFEGKLVPQDPNDEPAEKLLERIKASRAGATVRSPARKRS